MPTAATPSRRSPFGFFALVVALSIPFWIAGELLGQRATRDLPVDLPLSSLMTFNPLIAALILVYRESGSQGVRDLLKRAVDFRRSHGDGYAVALLLPPLVISLSYGLMLINGKRLPDPQVPLQLAPIFFIVFVVAAVGEEIGWQGYAFEPLRQRGNAFSAAMIIGVVWAAWHVIPYWQAQRTIDWILWQSLWSILLRGVIVWLYLRTGSSVLAAVLVHAMTNVSVFLFPNYGSYYDPLFASLSLGLVIGAAALIPGVRRASGAAEPGQPDEVTPASG